MSYCRRLVRRKICSSRFHIRRTMAICSSENDLSVQKICSSSSVKTANFRILCLARYRLGKDINSCELCRGVSSQREGYRNFFSLFFQTHGRARTETILETPKPKTIYYWLRSYFSFLFFSSTKKGKGGENYRPKNIFRCCVAGKKEGFLS